MRDFLQEIPELKRLSDEPAIAAALSRGDSLALYEALRRWRKQHPGTSEPWVDSVLANRRLFHAPIPSPPRMFTLNSLGTRLHGKSDVDARDGSYIATLSWVVLFIPFLPVRQYLVTDSPKGGWYFHAEVPMSNAQRNWRRAGLALLGLVLLAGAGAGALTGWRSSQATQVQLLNGLPVPVRIVVDAQPPLLLGPESHQRVGLKPGPHRFRAQLTGGEAIDEAELDVPRWSDLVVYNVLGSAPAYLDEVMYSSESSPSSAGRSSPLAGRRLFTQSNVPYIFAEPPDKISMSSHQKAERRFSFGVAEHGWRTAVRMLENASDWKGAAELAAAIVRVDPESSDAREQALTLAHRAAGNDGVRALAHDWIVREPENSGAQRLYVDALRGMGRGDEAMKFAQERLRALPESIEFAELLARAEDPEPALERLRALVAAHPKIPRLRRLYAERLLSARRPREALAEFERLGTDDAETQARAAAGHARSLFLLSRPKDACALLESRGGPTQTPLWQDVVLYGQLALHTTPGTAKQPARYVLNRFVEQNAGLEDFLLASLALEQGASEAAERVQAVKNPIQKEALSVRLAAGESATAALQQAKGASDRALAQLDDPTALMLALEAHRAGDERTATRLERAITELRLDLAAARGYVERGEHPERLAEWSLDLQAVLELERGRQLESAEPAAVRALYARARNTAPPGGPVFLALTRWELPSESTPGSTGPRAAHR